MSSQGPTEEELVGVPSLDDADPRENMTRLQFRARVRVLATMLKLAAQRKKHARAKIANEASSPEPTTEVETTGPEIAGEALESPDVHERESRTRNYWLEATMLLKLAKLSKLAARQRKKSTLTQASRETLLLEPAPDIETTGSETVGEALESSDMTERESRIIDSFLEAMMSLKPATRRKKKKDKNKHESELDESNTNHIAGRSEHSSDATSTERAVSAFEGQGVENSATQVETGTDAENEGGAFELSHAVERDSRTKNGMEAKMFLKPMTQRKKHARAQDAQETSLPQPAPETETTGLETMGEALDSSDMTERESRIRDSLLEAMMLLKIIMRRKRNKNQNKHVNVLEGSNANQCVDRSEHSSDASNARHAMPADGEQKPENFATKIETGTGSESVGMALESSRVLGERDSRVKNGLMAMMLLKLAIRRKRNRREDKSETVLTGTFANQNAESLEHGSHFTSAERTMPADGERSLENPVSSGENHGDRATQKLPSYFRVPTKQGIFGRDRKKPLFSVNSHLTRKSESTSGVADELSFQSIDGECHGLASILSISTSSLDDEALHKEDMEEYFGLDALNASVASLNMLSEDAREKHREAVSIVNSPYGDTFDKENSSKGPLKEKGEADSTGDSMPGTVLDSEHSNEQEPSITFEDTASERSIQLPTGPHEDVRAPGIKSTGLEPSDAEDQGEDDSTDDSLPGDVLDAKHSNNQRLEIAIASEHTASEEDEKSVLLLTPDEEVLGKAGGMDEDENTQDPDSSRAQSMKSAGLEPGDIGDLEHLEHFLDAAIVAISNSLKTEERTSGEEEGKDSEKEMEDHEAITIETPSLLKVKEAEEWMNRINKQRLSKRFRELAELEPGIATEMQKIAVVPL